MAPRREEPIDARACGRSQSLNVRTNSRAGAACTSHRRARQARPTRVRLAMCAAPKVVQFPTGVLARSRSLVFREEFRRPIVQRARKVNRQRLNLWITDRRFTRAGPPGANEPRAVWTCLDRAGRVKRSLLLTIHFYSWVLPLFWKSA